MVAGYLRLTASPAKNTWRGQAGAGGGGEQRRIGGSKRGLQAVKTRGAAGCACCSGAASRHQVAGPAEVDRRLNQSSVALNPLPKVAHRGSTPRRLPCATSLRLP